MSPGIIKPDHEWKASGSRRLSLGTVLLIIILLIALITPYAAADTCLARTNSLIPTQNEIEKVLQLAHSGWRFTYYTVHHNDCWWSTAKGNFADVARMNEIEQLSKTDWHTWGKISPGLMEYDWIYISIQIADPGPQPSLIQNFYQNQLKSYKEKPKWSGQSWTYQEGHLNIGDQADYVISTSPLQSDGSGDKDINVIFRKGDFVAEVQIDGRSPGPTDRERGRTDESEGTLSDAEAIAEYIATKLPASGSGPVVSTGQGSSPISEVTTGGSPVTKSPETGTQVGAQPLHANIYATEMTGPAPLRVDFSDTSTGAVASRLWTFGDGYKSEVVNPGHTYREPGTYRVQLTIYDGLGQSDSATETIVVEPAEGVTPGPSPSGPGITTTPTIQSTPGPGTETPSSPITPGDAVSGMEAGIAGILGGAIALGATAGLGWLPGGGTPPGSAQDLEDEYRRLLDTIATEKANRDAWAQEGQDSGRDGMISLLEEEAERRRQELESLGIIPDYEGNVDGFIGPSSHEKEIIGLEESLKSTENWAYNEYYNLFKTELDYQKFLQEQRIRHAEWDAGRINTITLVGGMSGTGSEALNMATFGISGAGFDAMTDPSLGGLFNLRRPLRFLDNMRENYTAEHVRDMLLPIEETKTLIRAFEGDAEWHEVVGAASSGFLKVVTLGRISKGMMGETPVTEDVVSRAIEEDSLRKANENIKIQEENLKTLKGLKDKVLTVDGKKVMPMDEAMEILRNPDKGRIMKNPAADVPADVREAYANTREEINQVHDSTLKEWAKENIEGLKNADVEVLDFSTPGKDPLLPSVDRDYRLVEVLGRDSNKKPVAFREIDPQLWKDKSQQTFAEITNAPEEVSPSHYAEAHQYEATTKFDTQACRDFSDQILNEKGKIVTGEPNILKVKRGESLLEDPQGFSEMWKDKVSRAPTTSEAVQQAGKCIEQYEQVRKGTAEFLSGGTGDMKLGKISEPVRGQMEAIKEYIKDPTSKEANVALAREVPDINQFMQKMDGLIRALPRKARGGL